MPRPIKIILPNYRPRTCAECPLLGVRPERELEPGSKWTHKCMLDDRIISGRGSKQPAARNRCSVKQYEKAYFTCQGNFYINEARMRKYKIEQTKILFPPQ